MAESVFKPQLQLVESSDPDGWDRFVEAHPESRFCHLWGYRHALEVAYRFRLVYLEIITKSGRVGVLPSLHVERAGGYLLSQPFVEYGGPLCNQFTREDYAALAELLAEAARARNCQRVLIRGGIGAEQLSTSERCVRAVLQLYGELDLDRSKDYIWHRCLTQKARNAVRSSKKAGLRCEIRRGADAVRAPFYDLYAQSMKRLSVPPHSRLFFEALAASLGEKLVSCWAFKDQKPLAILLGGISGMRLHCIIMASDELSWSLHPNDMITWGFIEWALSQGLNRFDLGSAGSESQLRFKRKWGADMKDYAQFSISVQSREPAPEKISEHTLGKKLWRYVPLWASTVVGPSVRKRLL
jgi:CelD/BcsL family acetyltransferase involved in cellulose biosynthesis